MVDRTGLARSLGFAQNAISGTIKNQNNEPISNVEISILDATIQTKSNENGQFEIKNLPIGKRNLIFKSPLVWEQAI